MNARTAIFLLGLGVGLAAAQEPPGRSPAGDARDGRPGPWDQDVAVFRVERDGRSERIWTFPRAGVASVARLGDGRLIAAHQHFPEGFGADFDKVAVHFSEDDGRTWSDSRVIVLAGLPEEMRFPFDPTLVPLPDGRVRLYFTSVKGRRIDQSPPAIHSAISKDGVNYEYEPGVRFAIEGRVVIDCAVVLHQGKFHLYSPDNGPAGSPPGERHGADGVGYHAVSDDGLVFRRMPDVRVDGRRHWLGCAFSEGEAITFFGSGMGLWTATSPDGAEWKLGTPIEVRAADPGVVRLKDGALLVVASTGPRPGTPSANRRPTR
jgi:hypothetical protein